MPKIKESLSEILPEEKQSIPSCVEMLGGNNVIATRALSRIRVRTRKRRRDVLQEKKIGV
jgi:hypothetical protein